jgi:hypothetical protein
MKAILAKLALGALLLLALAAVAASCGKGKGVLTTTNTLVSAHHSAAQDSGVHKAKSLSELNALEKPLQADPDTWLAMKAKLARLLTAKYGSGKSAMKYVPNFNPLNEDKTSASRGYVFPRDLHWEPALGGGHEPKPL